VEFQIIGIHADTPQSNSATGTIPARTRVRYDLVGTGSGFHSEQRVGHLDLDWELGPGAGIQLLKWRNVEETRSRSLVPIFEDRAAEAFGKSESFRAQFLRGGGLLANGSGWRERY
jgi:hypothetical protein